MKPQHSHAHPTGGIRIRSLSALRQWVRAYRALFRSLLDTDERAPGDW